jgi:cytoskeletal protein RodZ
MKYKNSSTKQKNNKKPTIILVLALVVLLAAGAGLWLYKHRSADQAKTDQGIKPQNTVDYSPGTDQDNQATDQNKGSSDPKDTLDDSANNSNNTPTPGNFTVTITGANPDPNARVVRVSTLVQGVTSGTCVVSLTKTGQTTVTATNQVTVQNNSYVCPNFVIPYDQIPTSGQWNVSVTVTNNNKTVTGQWQGGAITIQK